MLGVLLTLGCGTTESPVRHTAPWVDGAWVRASAAGNVTGAYAVIHNPGPQPRRVIGVTSPLADTVEMHETMDHDGMVHMTPLPDLVIPAGDSVILAPGGRHFMVKAPRQPLVAGEQLPLRLTFDDGSFIEIAADVRPIGSR